MRYTWLVEKYLEGELSGEALRNFELEILRKPEVAEELERIRALNRFMKEQHHKMQHKVGVVETYGDMENVIPAEEIGEELEGLKVRKISSAQNDVAKLRTKIAEYHAKENLNRNNSRKILIRKTSVWLTAASVALLLTVSSILVFRGGNNDYTGLYNEYYTPRPADIERAIISESTPWQLAMEAYGRADYKEAFQSLNTIPEENVNNSYYLYKGVCAMELGRYTTAIEQFNKLDDDITLSHEGMWYKSLCYLGMEDKKSARTALKKIIDGEGYYKDKAQKLLRKL